MVCDSFCGLYSVLKLFVLTSLLRSRILNVDPSIYLHTPNDEDTRVEDFSDDVKLTGKPHPDERQIQLDTDRSFVLYPVGEPFPVSSHCPEALTRVVTNSNLGSSNEGTGKTTTGTIQLDCSSLSETTEVELLPGAILSTYLTLTLLDIHRDAYVSRDTTISSLCCS